MILNGKAFFFNLLLLNKMHLAVFFLWWPPETTEANIRSNTSEMQTG